MREPIIVETNIVASGRVYSKVINLVRTRTMSVTCRCKFNASGTKNAELEVYYSIDGKKWDTKPYATLPITVSAGAEVQESAYVVVPEHGYVKTAIRNVDTVYTLTFGKAWYSIQSYPGEPSKTAGAVYEEEAVE